MDQKMERRVIVVSEGKRTEKMDLLATERPLTVSVNGRICGTLLASPGHLDELALGYAFNEGLLSGADDLFSLSFQEKDTWAEIESKNLPGGAGAPGDCRFSPARIYSLMQEFSLASALFRETGGVHGAALANGDGILIFREDVARHNAIDKIAGNLLLRGGKAGALALLLSGRISAQVVKKACRMGIGLVVSSGAVTTLAVDMAVAAGLTLVGFARDGRFNIYCHPQRVIAEK